MIQFKKLLVRTLSGAVLVATLLAAILLTPWAFIALILVISSVGIWEFHHISNRHHIEVRTGLAITANILLQLCAAAYAFRAECCEWMEWEQPQNALVFFTPYVAAIILMMVSELFRKKPRPLHNLAYLVLGQVFVAIPFATLYGILNWHGAWHPLIVLAIFIIIWANDTFAYLVGSMLGRHHLLEHISPKKTWEGFAGGAVAAMLVGFLFGWYGFSGELTLAQWLIFAALVVVFGTLGDLMESLLKRSVGTKDSGNIIPGHGGILDRFDSLLLAGPVVCFYLMFF